MTTALFAVPGILAPLQGLFRWFAAGALPGRSGQRPAAVRAPETHGQPITVKSIADCAHHTRASSISKGTNSLKNGAAGACRAQPASSPACVAPARLVLRVMRVLEAGQAPASVGRMVISGRMADVCAELDRLAAREAALH